MSSQIKLDKIVKAYRLGDVENTVLHGVSLQIAAGEMLAIMGPSGSGKSTLMNIIGLLDRPTSGNYSLDGRVVSQMDDDELAALRNLTIGFVFQQFFLLPRLTAAQNIALPLTYRDTPVDEINKKVQSLLQKVGMSDRGLHRPNALSGGQQQRVAIARALVGDPRIILADEPTGALDSKTGADVMNLLKQLNQEEKTTVIIVTHDQNIGDQCERIITIRDGVLS